MRLTDEQLNVYRNMKMEGATDAAMAYVREFCQAHDVDPFAGEVVFTKYRTKTGDTWQPIIGIDGCRRRAMDTGETAGQDAPVYGTDEIGGEFCEKTVYRAKSGNTRYPTTHRVYKREFNTNMQQWKNRPLHMLAIRAESHALKMAFFDKFKGLSVEGELDGDGIAAEPVVQATTGKPDHGVRFSKVVAAFGAVGVTKSDLLKRANKKTVEELDEADFEAFTAWHKEAMAKA